MILAEGYDSAELDSIRRRWMLRTSSGLDDCGFWRCVVAPVIDSQGDEAGFDLELRLMAVSGVMARWP